MSLPWVRLDSHIASHDKILALVNDPAKARWQAAFSYVSALGWAGDQGTDGRIPAVALPFVHGTTVTARLLVKYQLWDEGVACWQIRNFTERQEMAMVTASKRESKRMAAEKGNCTRWHGPDCWKAGVGCGRAIA